MCCSHDVFLVSIDLSYSFYFCCFVSIRNAMDVVLGRRLGHCTRREVGPQSPVKFAISTSLSHGVAVNICHLPWCLFDAVSYIQRFLAFVPHLVRATAIKRRLIVTRFQAHSRVAIQLTTCEYNESHQRASGMPSRAGCMMLNY